MPRLGILAGGGDLPARLVESCRRIGRDVFVVAFEGHTDPETVGAVPHIWTRIGAAGRIIDALKSAGVVELVMAGRIRRPSPAELRPDLRGARLLARIGTRALGDDGLLRAVSAELEGEGFRIVGIDRLLDGLLTPAGLLTRAAPDAQAESDMAHGIRVARLLGEADVGQAVVVQQGIVLGVEAIEGTDALLERCGELRRDGPGGVLVKMCKPGQDRRFDLPALGPATIVAARAAGLRGIAAEAGATILVDREGMIAASDAAGLFLVGVGEPA